MLVTFHTKRRDWDNSNFVPVPFCVITIITESKRAPASRPRPYKPPNLAFQDREYQVRGLIFWGLTAYWLTLF